MQRQKQHVDQEVTETGCLKTRSSNEPGRAFECDINKGQSLIDEKVPQGHSHCGGRTQPVVQVMGTGTPGFHSLVPLTLLPFFWKVLPSVSARFTLSPPRMQIRATVLLRSGLCSKCSFVQFQGISIDFCSVPDVYQALDNRVQEGNKTLSLP